MLFSAIGLMASQALLADIDHNRARKDPGGAVPGSGSESSCAAAVFFEYRLLNRNVQMCKINISITRFSQVFSCFSGCTSAEDKHSAKLLSHQFGQRSCPVQVF